MSITRCLDALRELHRQRVLQVGQEARGAVGVDVPVTHVPGFCADQQLRMGSMVGTDAVTRVDCTLNSKEKLADEGLLEE